MTIYLYYATKAGDPDWAESLMAERTSPMDAEECQKYRAWAESQGYDRFREATHVDGAIPNFGATVQL